MEQFIGRSPADSICIRHIEIRPAAEQVEVWIHDVEDVGSEVYSDLYDFPYLEPDGPAEPVATLGRGPPRGRGSGSRRYTRISC